MRVLVVYYQPASASADIAASIAEHLDADTEVVRERDVEPRRSRGVLGSVVDALRERAMTMARISSKSTTSSRSSSWRRDLYDVVVIAAAGWETMTSVRMREAIRVAGRGASATALVYVGRRTRADRVVRQMQRASGRAPAAVLTLDHCELTTDASMRKTIGFADEVRSIAERIVDRRLHSGGAAFAG
jgi:hypothetical protein